MKRIKMPFYMRMQNFMELPSGEIFWTSATLTWPQKIKRRWNNDKSEMCNTSRGYTLPFHGQNVRAGNAIVYNYLTGRSTLCHDTKEDIEVYDLTTGQVVELQIGESTLPYKEVAKIKTVKVQQGVCYNPNTSKYDYVVFGSRGKGSIEVRDIYTGKVEYELLYKDFKKWYWSNWEAEGLQYRLRIGLDDELEIGISVKTIFGAILNYTHKV